MIEKIYIIFIICIVLFTIIRISKNQLDRKQRKNKEIIRLNRSLTNLTFGFIWVVFFIIWSSIFVNGAQKVYQLLNEEYINSIFQLLNVEYLKSLRRYFYENSMLMQLSVIAYYESNLLNMLTWIIGSFCVSILHFHMGGQKNAIYENGVLVNGKIVNWQEITNYKWSNDYKERLFKAEKYYDLIITLPKWKICDLDNKVKLQVNYDDKGSVDDILKKHVNE